MRPVLINLYKVPPVDKPPGVVHRSSYPRLRTTVMIDCHVPDSDRALDHDSQFYYITHKSYWTNGGVLLRALTLNLNINTLRLCNGLKTMSLKTDTPLLLFFVTNLFMYLS